MSMSYCPNCKTTCRQVRAGKNPSGSQRYRCGVCGKKYTPQHAERRYPPELHEQAVRLYLAGNSYRQIARSLGVNHQSVINWIQNFTVRTSRGLAFSVVHRLRQKG